MRFCLTSNPAGCLHAASRKSQSTRTVAVVAVCLILAATLNVQAQKQFRKIYPARSNVRLQLKNWSGTIHVEAWERAEIEVRSEMEKGVSFAPQISSGALEIEVNPSESRGEMGYANFMIRVPVNAAVILETRQGNIIVRGVRGDLVRAAISTRGDIELTEINATQVYAKTRGGDIFYAGDIRPQGIYSFMAADGDVRLRLPQSAQFSLEARAPITRNIDLGNYNNFLNRTDNGRRATGSVGRGNASCDVTAMRGSIFLLR